MQNSEPEALADFLLCFIFVSAGASGSMVLFSAIVKLSVGKLALKRP
jgi:hypothetical protein